jgi:NADH-quinone oxidoreductase subunit N
MNNASYADLLVALRPELCLVVGALAVLAVDIAARSTDAARRLHVSAALGALAVVAALIVTLTGGQPGPLCGGVLELDLFAQYGRAGALGLALLTLGILPGAQKIRHPAEFVAVLLFATAGFTLMAAARQLLVAFVAIELASLSLYVLAGFDKSRPASAEAGLKYFLVGGMSAAFLLFGFSLLYGLTGSIELPVIALQLQATSASSPLLLVALGMVLVGFGFKAAAAPFHLWAPDVYEGAPAPAAALVASASKLAGLVVFFRLLWPGLGAASGDLAGAPGWAPIVAFMALGSLLVGNLGALAQTKTRRLLAYSAIAHAGAMLFGMIAAGSAGPAMLVYYGFTYGLATVGAFGVVAVLERAGVGPELHDLAGLRTRSPFLAACLAVFVLSLAGVPPLAGFVGKFLVFAAAFKLGGASALLAGLAILLGAVALYYYLQILKPALITPAAKDAAPIPTPFATRVVLVLASAALLVLGVAPTLLSGF